MTWLFRYWRDSDKKQLNQVSIRFGLILFLLALLTGCSNGSGSGAQQTTGRFIDASVQGLVYICSSSTSGTTNANGEYTCPTGDNVTFSLGGQNIGALAAQSTFLTPYSFFPNNFYAAINLARLLQTIDADGDPDNANIIVDPGFTLPTNTDFTSLTFEQDIEAALTITLISAIDAQNRLHAAILAEGGTIPTGTSIPVANAGPDQSVSVGTTVQLDGGGSSDADGDSLTYQWSMTSKPTGSSAALSDPSVINPTFSADMGGGYVIQLIVNDGNTNSAADTVQVSATDTLPPSITADNPTDGATITDVTQSLTYDTSDDYSGVDADTLLVKIDNVDKSQLASHAAGKITITPDQANRWQAGVVNIVIELSDQAGNQGSSNFSYTVQPDTQALPSAKPGSGFAPLTTTFYPFNTSGTAIERYEWDFDGDGSFDVSETVGSNQTRTYNTPGTYTVSLRLTDSEGTRTTGTVDVDVQNKPPVVSAQASPSNGSAPLDVTFSANTQDNEGIAFYEWDFEGNGTYNQNGASLTTASHTYDTQGEFQPVLRVTDTLGAQTTYALSDIEVRVKPEGYPTVTAQASPVSGTTPLAVSFSATANAVGGRTINQWEWDFDGDDTFDFSSATGASTSHTYNAAGDFFAKVRVTDSDNKQSEDVIRISVNPALSMSIATDTIDTANGEAADISTVLGGDLVMSLVIEDRYGNPVKTLVPKGVRNAGNYTDSWAGDDDDGNTVGEGDYRAVIVYEVDGVEERYDLSLSTGGNQYNPSRTGIPNNFQPFAGNPLVIDFTLNSASEVTAFMGRYNTNARLITFMQREPLGTGTHRIIWNGEDSTGQLIHPPSGDSFLFGLFGYTLPDNAIYVHSGAHIQDLTIAPAILVPDSIADSVSRLSFTLTNAADVRLTVYNADEGTLMTSKIVTGLSAGANEVTWDGKNNQGIYVTPGKYRLGLTAIDSTGYQSITRYVVQQVYY
jgi:PKD repeat protein